MSDPWSIIVSGDGVAFIGADSLCYAWIPRGDTEALRVARIVHNNKIFLAKVVSDTAKALEAQALEYQAAKEARRQAEAAKAAARADRLALRARARIKIDPRMSVFSVASPALSRESKADIEVLHGLSAGVASIFEDAQSLRGTHDSSLTSELQYRGTSCE